MTFMMGDSRKGCGTGESDDYSRGSSRSQISAKPSVAAHSSSIEPLRRIAPLLETAAQIGIGRAEKIDERAIETQQSLPPVQIIQGQCISAVQHHWQPPCAALKPTAIISGTHPYDGNDGANIRDFGRARDTAEPLYPADQSAEAIAALNAGGRSPTMHTLGCRASAK